MVRGTTWGIVVRCGLIIAVAFVSANPVASAHETDVHSAIIDAAFEYWLQQRPEIGACRAPEIRDALKKGVVDEDDAVVAFFQGNFPYVPNGRFMFHFLDRLVDEVDVPGGTIRIDSSCDSKTWGAEDGASCTSSLIYWVSGPFGTSVPVPIGLLVGGNAYERRDALAGLQFPPGTSAKRAGLVALGHYLHLIQDLTSPAHTHVDAHPPGFDDSILETKFSGIGSLATHMPSAPLLEFDEDESPFLEDDTAAFLYLRDYVAARFHSEKSAAFDVGLANLPLVGGYAIGTDPLEPWRTRKLAKKEWGTGRFTIDRRIAQEQFDELMPLAIWFTASVIDEIHDDAPLCEQKLRVQIVGAGSVSSAGNGRGQSIGCSSSGGSCEEWITSGDSEGLISLAEPGWVFAGWQGGSCPAGNGGNPLSGVCSLRMTGQDPVIVSAIFVPQ